MDFELPESLASLSLDELNELEAQALAAHSSILETDEAEMSDEQVDQLELASDAVARIRTERESRQEAAAKRSERIASARSKVTASDDPPEEPTADDPPAAADPADADTEASVDDTTELTASGAPAGSAVAVLDKKGVRPTMPAKSKVAIAAAGDVPRHSTGQELDGLDGVIKAYNERLRTLPKKPMGSPGNRIFNRYGVATFSRGDFDGLTDTNPDFQDPMALLKEAARESRLSGQSLTAAGGWCAPSQTIYDLCSLETTDGLVDVPEIQITRGGIRFTTGPDFSAIFNATGFCQTEAQAEAGTEKPCFDIPCPPFEEVRLDVCGFCLRAGILTNVGYPEVVDRWITGSMIAFQHRMSARVINEIAALLGAPLDFPGDGTFASVLSQVEAVIDGQREAFRMAMGTTLEVIAPFWLRSVLRADLAYRNGVALTNVTNEMIDSHFAVRGARVQWVYNWQPLNAACNDGYPESVELLIYPAGTFVKGVQDVIQLDAVYDTAGLQENTYTATFFEEGILVAKTCHGGCRISLPLCISGRTGAADLTACALVAGSASS